MTTIDSDESDTGVVDTNKLNLWKNTFVVRSGFMTKQGAIAKTWKRRYFELLNSGDLLYYKDLTKSCSKPLGMLNLSSVNCCKLLNLPNGHGFSLVTSDRTWYFLCDCKFVRNEWHKVITRVLAHIKSHRKSLRSGRSKTHFSPPSHTQALGVPDIASAYKQVYRELLFLEKTWQTNFACKFEVYSQNGLFSVKHASRRLKLSKHSKHANHSKHQINQTNARKHHKPPKHPHNSKLSQVSASTGSDALWRDGTYRSDRSQTAGAGQTARSVRNAGSRARQGSSRPGASQESCEVLKAPTREDNVMERLDTLGHLQQMDRMRSSSWGAASSRSQTSSQAPSRGATMRWNALLPDLMNLGGKGEIGGIGGIGDVSNKALRVKAAEEVAEMKASLRLFEQQLICVGDKARAEMEGIDDSYDIFERVAALEALVRQAMIGIDVCLQTCQVQRVEKVEKVFQVPPKVPKEPQVEMVQTEKTGQKGQSGPMGQLDQKNGDKGLDGLDGLDELKALSAMNGTQGTQGTQGTLGTQRKDTIGAVPEAQSSSASCSVLRNVAHVGEEGLAQEGSNKNEIERDLERIKHVLETDTVLQKGDVKCVVPPEGTKRTYLHYGVKVFKNRIELVPHAKTCLEWRFGNIESIHKHRFKQFEKYAGKHEIKLKSKKRGELKLRFDSSEEVKEWYQTLLQAIRPFHTRPHRKQTKVAKLTKSTKSNGSTRYVEIAASRSLQRGHHRSSSNKIAATKSVSNLANVANTASTTGTDGIDRAANGLQAEQEARAAHTAETLRPLQRPQSTRIFGHASNSVSTPTSGGTGTDNEAFWSDTDVDTVDTAGTAESVGEVQSSDDTDASDENGIASIADAAKKIGAKMTSQKMLKLDLHAQSEQLPRR